MALDMTAQQREQGIDNFNRVSGDLHRRGFLKGVVAAAGAGAAGAGAYFGYEKFGKDKPIKVALIGCGDEGGVLAGEHDPEFVQIVAVSDIRPSNRKRIFDGQGVWHIRKGLKYHYGNDAAKTIKQFDGGYEELLKDEWVRKEVDAVIIALPLHQHDKAAVAAMKMGAERGRPCHVLCEKLMARTVKKCKEMIRTAYETGSILAIGHQRHYSLLYSHALEVLKSGVLGDIRHIRALWHRNNSWPYVMSKKALATDPKLRQPEFKDSWFKEILAADYKEFEGKQDKLRELGFDNIDQLIRWRLYNETGGGLMAELGSHQLDACSIFLNKVRPLAVSGVGVKSFYGPGRNDRSCDDHVFCTFEFPGADYDAQKNPEDIVVVTYSSVSTNAFENYGECIMGSRGTMIVEKEQAVMLYKEGGGAPKSTDVAVSSVGASGAMLDAAASGYAPPQSASAAATQDGPVSRGYREEMNHFAFCVQQLAGGKASYEKDGDGHFKQDMPRCHGEVAMADAIYALSANVSMDSRQRMEFKDTWFDFKSDEVPDGDVKVDQEEFKPFRA